MNEENGSQKDDGMERQARFSRCGKYRYALCRKWNGGESVMFVGLNPSTADQYQDDPTVRRCIRFARDWGFGRLVVVNLFAFRSTDPRVLGAVKDPVGPTNDRHIRDLASDVQLVIAAWGNRGRLLNRHQLLLGWLPDPHCLGITKSGLPRHPLYLRHDVKPFPFRC